MLDNRTAWRRYVIWITGHPYLVLGAALAVTLFLGFEASQVTLNNSRDQWLPARNQFVLTTRMIQSIFGGRDIVVIGIAPTHGDIYQPAVLARIARLEGKILRIPEVVRHNVASLSAPKVKALRGTPQGMEVHRMMERIPQTPQELRRLRQDIADNPFYVGALVSADARLSAIIADFDMRDPRRGYGPLNEEIMAAVDSERDPSVRLYVSGTPTAFAAVEKYSSNSSGEFFLSAFLIIMLVQLWAFRSWQGAVLPMLTAALSALWAIGLLRLFGLDLNSMNTITCILVMAITSGHAIQLLRRYYEEYERILRNAPAAATQAREWSRAAVVESLSQVAPVLVVSGAIAAVALFSLMLSQVRLIQLGGFIAGCGVLAGVALELTLIPALRSLLRPPRRLSRRSGTAPDVLDRAIGLLSARLTAGSAPWILAASLLALSILAAGTFRLRGGGSTMHYFATSDPVRVADRAINAALGGTSTLFFMVDCGRPGCMKEPSVLAAMDRLQSALNRQPLVGKTQSIGDLIKQMNRAMHDGNPAFYRLPSDEALISQYLLVYSLSGGPEDFSSYVDGDYRRGLLWTFIKTDDAAYTHALLRCISPLLSEFPGKTQVRIGGALAESLAVNRVVVHEKIINTLQIAWIILVLSSLLLRSFVAGVFVVVPVLIIALANFGVMGWLGIPLDMGTAITASMAISIGADYEIYLLDRFREELLRAGGDAQRATERALAGCGKAVIYVAAAIAGGYAALFVSEFRFYRELATAVVMTMFVSAFSAIVLLRAMTLVVRPRFIFGASLRQGTTALQPSRSA